MKLATLLSLLLLQVLLSPCYALVRRPALARRLPCQLFRKRRPTISTATFAPQFSTVKVATATDDATDTAVSATSLYRNAQKFYDAWNARNVDEAMNFFSENVVFYDAQYSRPFVGKVAVRKYIQECADSLPGWSFVIDDYSEDTVRRKVGLKWHVSDSSNVPLPFPNRGVSFLAFDDEGLIKVLVSFSFSASVSLSLIALFSLSGM